MCVRVCMLCVYMHNAHTIDFFPSPHSSLDARTWRVDNDDSEKGDRKNSLRIRSYVFIYDARLCMQILCGKKKRMENVKMGLNVRVCMLFCVYACAYMHDISTTFIQKSFSLSIFPLFLFIFSHSKSLFFLSFFSFLYAV